MSLPLLTACEPTETSPPAASPKPTETRLAQPEPPPKVEPEPPPKVEPEPEESSPWHLIARSAAGDGNSSRTGSFLFHRLEGATLVSLGAQLARIHVDGRLERHMKFARGIEPYFEGDPGTSFAFEVEWMEGTWPRSAQLQSFIELLGGEDPVLEPFKHVWKADRWVVVDDWPKGSAPADAGVAHDVAPYSGPGVQRVGRVKGPELLEFGARWADGRVVAPYLVRWSGKSWETVQAPPCARPIGDVAWVEGVLWAVCSEDGETPEGGPLYQRGPTGWRPHALPDNAEPAGFEQVGSVVWLSAFHPASQEALLYAGGRESPAEVEVWPSLNASLVALQQWNDRPPSARCENYAYILDVDTSEAEASVRAVQTAMEATDAYGWDAAVVDYRGAPQAVAFATGFNTRELKKLRTRVRRAIREAGLKVRAVRCFPNE